jgi:hypothetical protein
MERSQWQARADYHSRRGGASAAVQVPEVKPPFRDITVDEDGRIWVQRQAQATERRISTARQVARTESSLERNFRTSRRLTWKRRLFILLVVR